MNTPNEHMNSYTEFSGRLVTLNDGRTGIRGGLQIQVREPSGSQPVLEFIASDESLDRYNEVISATGWKLDNYRRNPVFQNAHQTGDIMHTLGRATATEVRGGKLVQTIEFACDVNPMARIAYGLYKGQFLRAVSVGFVPLRWENGTDKSAYARKFVEQELMEVSAVAIPANPNALALGVKSGAIEKSDMKDVVELFRSALADGPRTVPVRSNVQLETRTQTLQLLEIFHRLVRS
jgi:HK97 family phage prohead protease